MRLLVPLTLCLIFFSCHNDHPQKSNNKSALTTLNKQFKERVFSLDSLETNKSLSDSIMRLPKMEMKTIRPIVTQLPDNIVAKDMLLDSRYTSFRKIADININGRKGLVFARITQFDGTCGNIYLMIKNSAGNKTSVINLAEYFEAAGNKTYVRTTQTSENEFLQVSDISDIEQSDKPDSLGVNEAIGRWHEKVTRKLIFKNNRFTTTMIDSTYKIEK